MITHKIIIIDFAEVEVHVFPFDYMVYSNDEIQNFFDDVNDQYDLNLKQSNCEWLIKPNELTIKYY